MLGKGWKMKKILLSWSSGKDSAWSLKELETRPDLEVVGIFCTVNEAFDRVAMHAVRLEILNLQADRVGLPLDVINIPYPCSDREYAARMGDFVQGAVRRCIDGFAFGDLFLEDIRQYRIDKMADTGIEPMFPLWKVDTRELSQEMIAGGLRAKVTCVDPKKLPPEFAGREFDRSFLKDLPRDIDPCGENGEFHTCVYDAPSFSHAIDLVAGDVVTRDGFVFADFRPVD